MINLSKKAADRFKIKWKDLPEQDSDFWKIDVIMMSRYPVLLIVHERTLWTLVRLKSGFKTVNEIADEVLLHCPWYRFNGNVTIGKNTNKRLTGSMNEL